MMFRLSLRALARRSIVVTALGLGLSLAPMAAAGATEAETARGRAAADDRCENPGAGILGLLFRPQIEAHCLLKERRAARAAVAGPRSTEDENPQPDGEPRRTDAAAPAPASPAPCPPGGTDGLPVQGIVAEVFRCRLEEAGWSEDDIRRVTAEALVVADCESRMDPQAVVFNGRYRDVPHPNGNRYSAAGLFQFIRSTAELFVEGGYANVHDPVKNADAAARLYLWNVDAGRAGWTDWACVAVNDGFAKQSVLPGWPGGPAELPDWAWQH